MSIDKVLSIFSSKVFYMIAIPLFVLLITLMVLMLIKKRRRLKSEREMEELLDELGMRRTSINPVYLEKGFVPIVEQLVYSYYSQQPQLIPAQSMTHVLYMEWYNRLKREHDLKIKKTLYNFRMTKAKIAKIDNSSYIDIRAEMDAEFEVDYLYDDVTQQERISKKFRQTFIFLNMNDCWVLEKVLPEQILAA